MPRRSQRALLAALLVASCGGHEAALAPGTSGPGIAAPTGSSGAATGSPTAAAPTGPIVVRSERSGPPYPIVLAHGFAGWASIGPIEYFYQVPEALRADGHEVFVSAVDPFNDSYVRGAELLAFVKTVLAQTGAAKVDIIAHSQGGLDARWVANAFPEGVAAIVTLATPHQGTAVADAAVSGVGGPAVMAALEALLGGSAPDGGEVPEGFLASIQQLTSAGAAEFNQNVPDAAGVAYYSIAGRSNFQPGGPACQTNEPGFISKWDAYLDPTGPEFVATAPILASNLFAPTPNDGLVAVPSAHWGTFLGCIPADHFEEIGQLLGQPAGIGNPFAYKDFYRGLADWLVAQGY
jgi:triacylglycerol lipase